MRLLLENTSGLQDYLLSAEASAAAGCASALRLAQPPAWDLAAAALAQNASVCAHPHLAALPTGSDATLHHLATLGAQQASLLWLWQSNATAASAGVLLVSLGAQFSGTCVELFALLYVLALLWSHPQGQPAQSPRTLPHTVLAIEQLLYSGMFLSLAKLETTEEALVLVILWPWCFLVILTHMVTGTDHTLMFGFAEGGLPVVYGLAMLLEHCWALGTHFLPYLTGASGRRLSLATAIEDAAASAILVIRVLLQTMRGLIVGMFHFVTRELLGNLNSCWTHGAALGTGGADAAAPLAAYPGLSAACNVLLIGGNLVVVTAIMLLQLLFLLISVWLFCKCWFSSWRGAPAPAKNQ